MKKIASLFFCVLTFFSFSVGQPLINDLGFASLKIDSSAMESACEIYAQYFVDSSQKEKFIYDCADRNGIGFNSLLDSTVRIYFTGDETEQILEMTRISQNCVGPYPEDSTVGTPGTHQFSEVMMFELLRFQECGIINIQRDSLELLLVSAIAQIKAKDKKCPDLDWGSYGENSGAQWLFGPGCCSLVESPSAIFKISPAVGNIRIKEISSGKYQIDGIPEGTAYSLFNLNGQLISKGFVGNGVLEVPVKRAILKMNNKWFEL